MLLAWLPYFLEHTRGLSGAEAGLAASVLSWASIPGALAVSFLSDRLGSRLGPLRLLLPAAAASVLGLALVDSGPLLYGFLIMYGLFGRSAVDPLLVARVAELAPPGRSATTLGLLNFSGMVASVLAPYVTGALAVATGDMRHPFVLAAGILLGGSVLALAAGRPRAAGTLGQTGQKGQKGR
jgi:sugar phosphate permease